VYITVSSEAFQLFYVCCVHRGYRRGSGVQRLTSPWTEVNNIVSSISSIPLVMTRRPPPPPHSTTLTTQTSTSCSSSLQTTRRSRCQPTPTVHRRTVRTTTHTGTRYAPCRATRTFSKESCCDASTAIVSCHYTVRFITTINSKWLSWSSLVTAVQCQRALSSIST